MTKQTVETQMSLYLNARDKNPHLVSIDEVYRLITSDAYRESTDKYRYFRSQQLDRDAEQMKRLSACVVTAGICRGGHKLVDNLVRYTGMIMSDFDDIPAERLDALLSLLNSDPYVLLTYTTISGCGLRIIYRTDVTDVRFHAQAHAQGNAYFARLLDHPFDPKCKDPMRMSYLCHDPKALYHPSAGVMLIDLSQSAPKHQGRPHKLYICTAPFAAEVILPELDRQGKAYVEGRRNEYISSALYLMNRYGVAEPDALAWASSEYPDFNQTELESVCRSIYQHTDEHGCQRLPLAQQASSNQASVEDLETFITSQAQIRYNTVLDRREICWNEDEHFHDITDSDENTLWLRARKSKLYSSQRTFLSILKSEFVCSYNPLKDYLAQLPEWDGVTDYIARTATLVHTSDDYLFGLYFRKWFVAFIAALWNVGVVNHTILVLIGRQGIYKTTFFNRLLPPRLQRYFHTKTNSGQMTKDDNFSLAESALLCIEEIDNMRPSELNRLKAMVTMTTVNERAAYDRNKSYRPHIASFCATGNNKLFLVDDSGNRRWLPFWVHGIANMYTAEIAYDELYAQALSLCKSGFQYWFSDEEMEELNRHNRDFEEPNIEEELILSRLRKPHPGESGVFMSTAEIMERIGMLIKYSLSKSKINRAMLKLGFQGVHRRSGRGFRVMLLTQEEIAVKQVVTSSDFSSDELKIEF